MGNDFVLLNLAFELKFTIDLLEKLVLSRSTQQKSPTLNSNDFENIRRAVNRRSPIQVDQILTSCEITAKHLECNKRNMFQKRKKHRNH